MIYSTESGPDHQQHGETANTALLIICYIITRLASLEGSVDSLPCSLVLVDSECARVVGHARLMAVAGSPTGALVESGSWNILLCTCVLCDC